MKPMIAYQKLSKKKKRELDLAKRKDWGNISPVTRKSANPRAYNRKRQFRQDDGFGAISHKRGMPMAAGTLTPIGAEW